MIRLVLILSWLAAGLSVQGQSLLWRVSGNGLARPSYLFGTYHLLRESYLTRDSLTRTHFEQAEGVVVEMLFDSLAMGKVIEHGQMTNRNLIQLIDASEYKLVADEFNAATGKDLSFYNQFKPVVIAVALSTAYARQNADTLTTFSGQPIDLYFATHAKEMQKPVQALETLDEQLTLLYDRQPVEQQARQLVKLVKNRHDTQPKGSTLTELYLKADLDGMWAFFQQNSDSPADLHALTDSRNRRWMSRLRTQMAERSTFIAVGVGHLPGPGGLLTLLREAGYVVDAVN